MVEPRKFRVHTIDDTVVVMWLDGDLARSVTANVNTPGATYAREVSPGIWRRTPVHRTNRITFKNAAMLSSLVRRMILDDTLPKV